MQNTPEQQKVIDSRASFLKVNAFAGAGKTTTLVQRAKARPGEKMLYLAFNRSIKDEAKSKFPRNVRCVTSHGIAFAKFGVQYSDAGKIVEDIRVNNAVEALNLGNYPEDFRLFVADATLKSVRKFLASDEDLISEDMCSPFLTPGSGLEPGDIAILANKLWGRMCDLKDGSVGMLHDGYLKLYQLSRPVLEFDTILFDEAQDANPVTADIFDRQQACKVVVGDAHQQLYSFRGAMNAMRKFEATESLYLTKSFRFGQGIADVANLLLSTFKGERHRLEGTRDASHIGRFPRTSQCAVIARANGTLFDEAAQAIAQGKRVAFVGGIGGYRVTDTLDAYNLWSGNKDRIQNPYLRSFREFDRMEEYAGAVDDRELKSLISLVKRHGSKLPRLVSRIREGTEENASNAHVILTTAHKSKGMEWNNVRLTNDYMDLLDDKGKPRQLTGFDLEEINIIYVAATRARKALTPFPDLQTLIEQDKLQNQTNKMPEWARPAQIQPIARAPMRALGDNAITRSQRP